MTDMRHEKENLSSYLDGAVADSERGRIEAHLKDCPKCRAELDALRAVSGLVHGLPQKPLPAGFLLRLQDRRRREAGSEGWASLWAPRNVAWAACAVTVIFVTYKTVNLYAPMPIPTAADIKTISPAAPPAALAGPVSTADLLALSKEQARAEGLAALRGSAGSASVSAAGLAAPASPKSFAGSAIGEAPVAKPAYTNESLQKHLEAERSRMGIQRIITPNSTVRTLRAAARDLAPAAGQSFDNESVPAPVSGKTTALLSQPIGASRGAAEGALVPPEDFSGGAGGSSLRAGRKKALGEPLPAAGEAGRAVYSMEETTRLWREQGWTGSAPRVDFSKEMLVVMLGQARIESVAAAANRIVVSYRRLESPPAVSEVPPVPAGRTSSPPAPQPPQRWRVIPRSDLPVIFLPAGRTSSPPVP